MLQSQNFSHLTPIIAIDGHAGAGKSTVADLVAHHLGFWHVNTGLYYRALTWLAFEQGLDPQNQEALDALAQTADIEVHEHDGIQDVYVNQQNVSAFLRTPAINRSISLISSYAGVRSAITNRLQHLQHPHGIIMDGRDIGTVVFPQANLKIFLTASVKERARRQHEEAIAKGQTISLAELQESISLRDQQDSEREVAPLKQAVDAVCIDSTGKYPQDIANLILTLWQEKAATLELSPNKA